jgi:amino acid transporter
MSNSKPQPILRTVDIISLIVGTVIGGGIFKAPAIVAASLGSVGWVIGAWILGGVASILGALCYAELATAHPNVGGEFHFIGRAYGDRFGFLYAWARATVIVPGSIAGLAVTLGDYLAPVFPMGAYTSTAWAVGMIIALSGLNALGVQLARTAQNIFAGVELITVCAIVVAGIIGHGHAQPVTAVVPASGGDHLGLAMVFVLLTYGGWNEAAYISAEVADGRRGILRGLLLGLGTVTVLYAFINAAYLWGLGHAGVAASQAPAADLFRLAFGAQSGTLLSAIVAFSCMKAISATIFFGARSNYAVGQNWRLFSWLGHWHPCGAPRRAIVVQAMISLALVGLAALTRNGFQAIVEFEAPVFWLFILLVAGSLFVLRQREGLPDGAFAVPLYPLVPALFVCSSAALLWSSVRYTGLGALFGVALLVAGTVPLWLERRLRR